MGYASTTIRLTTEMERYPIVLPALSAEIAACEVGGDLYHTYMRKMTHANVLRKQYGDPAVLARIAIDVIRQRRTELTSNMNTVCSQHAYIIRQLKRPEEVALLRQVYGRQFALASAYAPGALRKDQLCDRLRQELSTATKPIDMEFHALKLMDRDASEDDDAMGQQLRDTFHLADVFMDGLNKGEMDAKLNRFFAALFGRNDISPSKDEFGMYTARSAALRSADLSRQVGAAIFTAEGELITQGCNEVPRAGGGTYWDLELPDYRDIKKGYDPNERHKREILRELVERFREGGLLSPKALETGNDSQIVEDLISKRRRPKPKSAGAISASILSSRE
jgi:deoxycytidylate deaminase